MKLQKVALQLFWDVAAGRLDLRAPTSLGSVMIVLATRESTCK